MPILYEKFMVFPGFLEIISRCHMAFVVPVHCYKANVAYLLRNYVSPSAIEATLKNMGR